jgi:hypothetical protein
MVLRKSWRLVKECLPMFKLELQENILQWSNFVEVVAIGNS